VTFSDAINDDATLFMRADQVEAAWRLLMPVLEHCIPGLIIES
jgi:glucose-6-phosphate 1-dehydrogenase